MLKKKSGLFLGLVVLAGSACVTPTHASSAPQVIISHVQAGTAASALSELVVVHNNTQTEVDVTGWCVTNKSSVTLACSAPHAGPEYRVFLPPYKSALFASREALDEYSPDGAPLAVSGVIESSNRSSGGIVASADAISIEDSAGDVIDTVSWTTALPAGKVRQRMVTSPSPLTYASQGSVTDWYVGLLTTLPENGVAERIEDDDTQPQEPPVDEGTLPIEHPTISELLPNPDGVDTDGGEFIELHNSGLVQISLSAYTIRVGSLLEREYTFPQGAVLVPGYTAFSNNDIPFTLLNTTSAVQLYYEDVAVGEVVRYENPKSGASWSYHEGGWLYASVPSPGLENSEPEAVDDGESEVEKSVSSAEPSTLKPCAPNQYRSAETNRCRLIASATAQKSVVACKAGQVRNPATNRCVLATAATKTSTPCKEGQERNPATNRCVTIKKMTQAGYAVKGQNVTSEHAGVDWYALAGIVCTLLAVIGYVVWEWRNEIAAGARFMWQKFVRRAN